MPRAGVSRSMPMHAAEASAKAARNFGGAVAVGAPAVPEGHQHFGLVVASCEHADLRPTPKGVLICRDSDVEFEALPPPRVPREEVIDELHAAVVDGVAPLHDGRWGMATLEVCLAMRTSARERRDIALHRQIAVPAPARAS